MFQIYLKQYSNNKNHVCIELIPYFKYNKGYGLYSNTSFEYNPYPNGLYSTNDYLLILVQQNLAAYFSEFLQNIGTCPHHCALRRKLSVFHLKICSRIKLTYIRYIENINYCVHLIHIILEVFEFLWELNSPVIANLDVGVSSLPSLYHVYLAAFPPETLRIAFCTWKFPFLLCCTIS